jgi:hypothetical protein
MRGTILLYSVAVACGDGSVATTSNEGPGESGESTAVSSPTIEPVTDTTTADTTLADTTMGADTTTDDIPSGPCALEGMFVECTIDGMIGVAYCDEIDGELQWGPCLSTHDCVIGDPLQGCQSCTLVEGVPTIIGSATCECEGTDDLPACEQTECVMRWEYECGDCESFTGGGCFSYSEGCESPLSCALPNPPACDRVWAQGFSTLEALEDDAAAICLLESLRDDVPGTYEVLWGEMGDDGLVWERVHVFGNGTVLVEWGHDCPGCQNFGRVGRSGALELQPASYFDDCLAAPTTESLIACTIGLVEIDTGNPPEGYTPPFTTGECTTLDVACP